MFGLGWPEVGIILGVAVIIFGPKKLPELGGAIGKTLKGFKQEMAGLDGEAGNKEGDGEQNTPLS